MQGKAITFKLRFPTVSRQIEFDLDENDSFEEVALIASEELGIQGDRAHEKVEFFDGMQTLFKTRKPDGKFLIVKDVLNQTKGITWTEGKTAEITATPIYYGA